MAVGIVVPSSQHSNYSLWYRRNVLRNTENFKASKRPVGMGPRAFFDLHPSVFSRAVLCLVGSPGAGIPVAITKRSIPFRTPCSRLCRLTSDGVTLDAEEIGSNS